MVLILGHYLTASPGEEFKDRLLSYAARPQSSKALGQSSKTQAEATVTSAGDEVFIKINGQLHYLWRSVDQDGGVLDILAQGHRNKQAAKKFLRKL